MQWPKSVTLCKYSPSPRGRRKIIVLWTLWYIWNVIQCIWCNSELIREFIYIEERIQFIIKRWSQECIKGNKWRMWFIIAVNCDFLPSKSFQLDLKWEITHLSNIRENSKNILRLCDNRLDGVWLPGTAAPTHVLSPSGSVVVVSPLLRGRSSDSMLWRKVTVRIRKGEQ